MAQNTPILSVKYGSFNSNVNNVTNFNFENTEIMHRLSPLEPMKRHQDIRTGRLDCVGDWFLETNEFREWRSSSGGADKAVLFCSGNPGVGKTFLR